MKETLDIKTKNWDGPNACFECCMLLSAFRLQTETRSVDMDDFDDNTIQNKDIKSNVSSTNISHRGSKSELKDTFYYVIFLSYLNFNCHRLVK